MSRGYPAHGMSARIESIVISSTFSFPGGPSGAGGGAGAAVSTATAVAGPGGGTKEAGGGAIVGRGGGTAGGVGSGAHAAQAIARRTGGANRGRAITAAVYRGTGQKSPHLRRFRYADLE